MGRPDLNTGPATVHCVNLRGHPQTYAPDFTFNVGAQYDFKVSDHDTLTPAITYGHVSGQWASIFDNAAQGDYLTPRNILTPPSPGPTGATSPATAAT